jgi:hypothetical protein
MDERIVIDYELFFNRTANKGWGWGFPCDAEGRVFLDSLQKPALDNLFRLLTGLEEYMSQELVSFETVFHTAHCQKCGKELGEYTGRLSHSEYAQYDKSGIYCGIYCDDCFNEVYVSNQFDSQTEYEEYLNDCGEDVD